MADYDFAPATAVVEWDEPTTVLDVGGVSSGDAWTAFVTERDGTVVAEITDCNLGVISERLNGWPTFDLEVPKASAVAADLQRVVREVQVFRGGGNPKFVGPILQRNADSNSGAMSLTCAGVGWYLSRRLGSNYPNGNLFINPRFDDGFMAWTNTGVTLDSFHETGTQSVEFAGVSNGEVRQTVAQTISGKVTVMIEARVFVAIGASGSWRLFCNVSGAPTSAYTTIDAAGGAGAWRTVQVTLDVDMDTPTAYVYGGIDTVGGTSMFVDRMGCFVFTYGTDEVVEPELRQEAGDQVQHIRSVIQDRNAGLNLGVSTAPTDQLVFWKPQADADVDAVEILNRYTKRDNGVEWSITATALTRTLTTWFPRKGRDIDAGEVTLRLVADGAEPRNCSGYSVGEDASEAVSEMTTLGDSLFRGISSDAAAWGGLKLQSLQQAPNGTDRNDLEGISLRALRTSIGDTQVLTLDVDDGDLMDVIVLGDRVTVVVDDFDIQIDGIYRVVERRLEPKTDSMRLTLNPEPV